MKVGNEYGLHLAAGIMHSWIHGGTPSEALGTLRLIQHLREKIALEPSFFQNLVRTHFLENKHRITLTMVAGVH